VSAAEPVSPCIAICVLDPATAYCRGCFRTIDEISRWLMLDQEGKRLVLAAVAERRRLARPEATLARPGTPRDRSDE
jgi:hypothetical protein